MTRTLLLAVLLIFSAKGGEAANSIPSPECGVITSPRGERFEVGLVYSALIPSGLPDFNITLPIYGPVLGVPLFGGTLQLQGATGSDSGTGLTLYLAEATYRLEMSIPYFNSFALVGAHILHYSASGGVTHQGVGANFGIGLSFLMGRGFEMAFSLRTYVQQRSTISFGGGFSFLL